MAASPKKIATIEGYNNLPIDAQMSLSFCVGKVPASAWPEGCLSGGLSWGLIVVSGDNVSFTRYGSDMLEAVITHKQEIEDAQEEQARDLAGQAGGKYLDTIGLYELDKLSVDQWNAFIKHVCEAYQYNRLKSIMSKK